MDRSVLQQLIDDRQSIKEEIYTLQSQLADRTESLKHELIKNNMLECLSINENILKRYLRY